MKKNLRRYLILLILLPGLLLASCRLLPLSMRPSSSPSADSAGTAVPTEATAGGYVIIPDYSGLTPYAPPEEKFSRLSDGPLPELRPSADYGLLLPYAGEVLYGNGGWSISNRYGLTTAEGMIVTDPVFSGAWQAYYYNFGSGDGEYMPAYHLQRLRDTIDENDPWDSSVSAACALDGRWITPFDYTDIWFTDTVILLVRNYETNDVDVMDYDGRILYNSKSLSCYQDIPPESAYMFQSCYGEGVFVLWLGGGKTVYIEAETGKEHITDYETGGLFCDGLSAVMKNGLYGFVDHNFDLVIPLQYTMAEAFINGQSTVQYPAGGYAVIDRSGTPLMTAGSYINRWNGNIVVYDGEQTRYYGPDLKEITRGDYPLTTLDYGWFWYKSPEGVTVFNDGENKSFTLQGVDGVSYIRGGLAVTYVESRQNPYWLEGLVTLDGTVLLPPAGYRSIALGVSEGTGTTYVIAGTYDLKGRSSSFTVYDDGGSVLFEGDGYAVFLPQHDLFEIHSDFGFAYADLKGDFLFSISLMDYIPD